jgi:heat shock protein HtpX
MSFPFSSPDQYIIKGLKREENPDLYDLVLSLMKKMGFHKIKISIKPRLNNAYALGNNICLGEPLLKKLNKDELEGVIAHEFSHIHLRHSLTALFLSLLFMFPLLFFWVSFRPNDPTSAILVVLGLMIMIYGYKIRNWITFHQEINADILAIVYTKKANALKNALLKMEVERLTIKHSFLHALFINGIFWIIAYIFGFTHPKLTDRIQYLNLLTAIDDIE